MTSGIYAILGPGPRIYIGQSVDVDRRTIEHKKSLRKGKHQSAYLQNAFNCHGEASFHWITLAKVDAEDKDLITALEQEYMDKFRPILYNLAPAAGSLLGFKHSEETKKKIGAKHKNKVVSEETRRLMSEANKGKPGPTRGKVYSVEEKVARSIRMKQYYADRRMQPHV